MAAELQPVQCSASISPRRASSSRERSKAVGRADRLLVLAPAAIGRQVELPVGLLALSGELLAAATASGRRQSPGPCRSCLGRRRRTANRGSLQPSMKAAAGSSGFSRPGSWLRCNGSRTWMSGFGRSRYDSSRAAFPSAYLPCRRGNSRAARWPRPRRAAAL